MNKKIIPIVLAIFIFTLNLSAEKFEIQISYGGWSLSPFIASVEKESERIIGDELYSIVSTLLPGTALSAFRSAIDISSSGKTLDLSLWYKIGSSNFSLGLKGQVYRFQLPYSLDSVQSIGFLGIPLFELESQAEGEIILRSVILSPLARWTALSSKNFKLSLYGGFSVFHYDGDFSLNGNVLVRTALGDFEFHGEVSQSIEELREWSDGIPSWMLSPSFGLVIQYNLSKEFGLLVDLSLSHGFFFSAGVVFAIGSSQ
ncbi:MAG: hypothetical protein MUP98_04750 [Candidatus Aminicenantes bacterium]|nr:hypothetical protein [Candidatus Aminicenantes bacterium]